jgi:hypothetical protein
MSETEGNQNGFIYRKTKTFMEDRVYERPAGAPPDDWRLLKITEPLDDTINEWVLKNKSTIVTVSAPGIDSRWLNKDMTKRSVIVAVTVVYEGSKDGSWPERK